VSEAQTTLASLLRSSLSSIAFDPPKLHQIFVASEPRVLAEIFASSRYLISVATALREMHWLLSKSSADVDQDFLEMTQSPRLAYWAHLADVPWMKSVQSLKQTEQMCEVLSVELIKHIHNLDHVEFHKFARFAVAEVCKIVTGEREYRSVRSSSTSAPEKNLPVSLGVSLYRAFDPLDEVFGLTFAESADPAEGKGSHERLYLGSGVGVQTSYATIAEVLLDVKLESDATLVDLGSGFGRFGIFAGLYREDLKFLGYEFVESRVEKSNLAADRAGLRERIQFFQQDLAKFTIPKAQMYYMYDPFIASTYQQVLDQLIVFGKQYQIIIVTKGDAGSRLLAAIATEGWSQPVYLDGGNMLRIQAIPNR
jgi:hypothetical protein